jgi:hypothetical protein
MGKHKTKFVYDELVSISEKGFTAEIGVFMGFTSKVIALSNYNNTHFCYDTFEGVVKSDPKIDIHKDGDFSCNLDEVKKNINLPNIIYKKGTFPETFTENNLKFIFQKVFFVMNVDAPNKLLNILEELCLFLNQELFVMKTCGNKIQIFINELFPHTCIFLTLL